ncbi:MAG: hypothetical protein EOP83_02425 [Verrucomicrobiaceae bacterium]|nr:MAG: hypothetical protein EOP83_02425 [Verrucomicrobiaceae bacterium]
MSLDQLSQNDKVRLNQFMDSGMKVKQEMQDLAEGLKDTAKALAEEFNVKPGVLMKALNAAWKSNIDEQKESMDQVEAILDATGRR